MNCTPLSPGKKSAPLLTLERVNRKSSDESDILKLDAWKIKCFY